MQSHKKAAQPGPQPVANHNSVRKNDTSTARTSHVASVHASSRAEIRYQERGDFIDYERYGW